MKSEEFKLPEGWKWVKLGEVGEIIYGKGLRENEHSDDGVSLVFGTGGIIIRTKEF